MRFYEILREGYKEAEAEFSKTAEPTVVTTLISQYKDLVNRNQASGVERNIDYWRKQGFPAFQQFVTNKSQLKTSTQIKRNKSEHKEEKVLRDDDEWKITVPLNKEASCPLGSGTKWCVSANSAGNAFNGYFGSKNTTLIFCIRKSDNVKWAVTFDPRNPEHIEIFNTADKRINPSIFTQDTGLDALGLVSLATGHAEIDTARNNLITLTKEILDKLKLIWSGDASQDPIVEQSVLRISDPQVSRSLVLAYVHANKKLKPITPKLLKFLLQPEIIDFIGTEFRDFLKLLDPADVNVAAQLAPLRVAGVFPQFKSLLDKLPSRTLTAYELSFLSDAQYEYPDWIVMQFSKSPYLLQVYAQELINHQVTETPKLDRLIEKYKNSNDKFLFVNAIIVKKQDPEYESLLSKRTAEFGESAVHGTILHLAYRYEELYSTVLPHNVDPGILSNFPRSTFSILSEHDKQSLYKQGRKEVVVSMKNPSTEMIKDLIRVNPAMALTSHKFKEFQTPKILALINPGNIAFHEAAAVSQIEFPELLTLRIPRHILPAYMKSVLKHSMRRMPILEAIFASGQLRHEQRTYNELLNQFNIR